MPNPPEERSPERSATRAPLGQPVRLQYDDAGEPVEGLCVNVSIGGMFVRVDELCRQGGLIRFDLSVGDGEAVRGLGEAIWREEPNSAYQERAGLGIKFRYLESGDRQKILRLVSQHIKERLVARHPEFQVDSSAKETTPRAHLHAPSETLAEEPSQGKSIATETSPRIDGESGQGWEALRPETAPRRESATSGQARGERAEAPWRPPALQPLEAESDRSRPMVPAAPEPQIAVTRPLAAGMTGSTEEPSVTSVSEATASSEPETAQSRSWESSPLESNPPEMQTPKVKTLDLEDLPSVADLGESQSDVDWLRPVGGAPEARGSGRRRAGRAPWLWVAGILGLLLLTWLLRGCLVPKVEGDSGAPAAVEGATANPVSSAEAKPPAMEKQAGEKPAPEVGEPVLTKRPEPPSALPTSSSAPSEPFRRVLALRWSSQARGGELVIQTDGRIPNGSFSHFRLEDGSVREVVRLRGVTEPFRGQARASGPWLQQIRTGLHRRGGGTELHVVLDLLDSRVAIQRVEARGDSLVVRLAAP